MDASDIDLSPRTRGRPPVQVSLEIVRELTPEDLAELSKPRGSEAPTITRLRESHHALARALATPGVTQQIAGAMVGYSQSRVSILLQDPAFQQLVAFYREIPNQHFEDYVRKASLVRDDALHVPHERILDTPEELTPNQLLATIEVTSDRTGHGAQTKSQATLTVNVDYANRLTAARSRSGLTIDVTPNEASYALEPSAEPQDSSQVSTDGAQMPLFPEGP
jgi:hypothetical protein